MVFFALAVTPPGRYVSQNGLRVRPAINRQAESALRKHGPGPDRFPRLGCGVQMRFVISRHQKDKPPIRYPYLRRTQDVPGRMQAHLNFANGDLLSPGQGLDRNFSQAASQEGRAGFATQVGLTAPAGMIAMGMRNDGSRYGPYRINIKVSCWHVEALFGGAYER